MAVWLVMVALASVAASGALAWVAQRSAGREAYRAVQDLLQASLRMIEMRPPTPETVIVPPPDLRPYLEQLSRMGQGMARELAAGISLVVQGPPTQPPGQEAPGEIEQEKEEQLEFPAWESDETWGIRDDAEMTGDWSAHTVPVFPDGFGGNGFGAGGIHLPDNEGL